MIFNSAERARKGGQYGKAKLYDEHRGGYGAGYFSRVSDKEGTDKDGGFERRSGDVYAGEG